MLVGTDNTFSVTHENNLYFNNIPVLIPGFQADGEGKIEDDHMWGWLRMTSANDCCLRAASSSSGSDSWWWDCCDDEVDQHVYLKGSIGYPDPPIRMPDNFNRSGHFGFSVFDFEATIKSFIAKRRQPMY